MVNEAQVIAENRALMAALAIVENPMSPQEVPEAVIAFREDYPRDPSIEGALIDVSLWVICGRPGVANPPSHTTIRDRTLEDGVFQDLAEVWMSWAIQGSLSAEQQARLSQLSIEVSKGSTLHRMALLQWKLAIEALLKKDVREVRKRFRRALRIGSEYGTPSNPVIHWTYAASLFHEGWPSSIPHN